MANKDDVRISKTTGFFTPVDALTKKLTDIVLTRAQGTDCVIVRTEELLVNLSTQFQHGGFIPVEPVKGFPCFMALHGLVRARTELNKIFKNKNIVEVSIE